MHRFYRTQYEGQSRYIKIFLEDMIHIQPDGSTIGGVVRNLPRGYTDIAANLTRHFDEKVEVITLTRNDFESLVAPWVGQGFSAQPYDKRTGDYYAIY